MFLNVFLFYLKINLFHLNQISTSGLMHVWAYLRVKKIISESCGLIRKWVYPQVGVSVRIKKVSGKGALIRKWSHTRLGLSAGREKN